MRGRAARPAPQFGTPRILAGAGQTNLQGKTIPAPYKGWDASSPLESMDPAAAIILDNWFPQPACVSFRAGHVSHATGISGAVESLMAYHGPGATQKLFAARSSSIFDATSAGAVGAAAVSSLTNARWQHVNFTTPGGNFLFLVNGADAPRTFDGTSWATPTITGFTATQAVHVNAHKKRLWFVLTGTTKAAYLPVASIAGVASVFDLGSLMTKGGYLVAMATWARDSGEGGGDDLAVFITSKGQLIIYGGDDPASSGSWAVQGVYDVGPPLGRRCFTKVGGDLAIITIDGVVSLSQAITQDRSVAAKAAITARIQNAMSVAARAAGGNFGWQLIPYPRGTAAILNVPLTEGTKAHQYVMNTLTGAWCRYTGQNANCWEIFNDRLYMGGSGSVYLADSGSRDNGALIVGDLKTAFNYLGQRGTNKRYAIARALMRSDGRASPQLTINTDYRDFAPDTIASPFVASGATWNTFNWNDGSKWSGPIQTLTDWISLNDEGYCAAVRMRLAPQNEITTVPITLEVNGFDLKWEAAQGQL